jgi:hypothetical protein
MRCFLDRMDVVSYAKKLHLCIGENHHLIDLLSVCLSVFLVVAVLDLVSSPSSTWNDHHNHHHGYING